MKFLTIDYIKQHLRIDFDCEDAELELYGAAAEDTLLALVRRTEANIRDLNGGDIPAAYYQLALMLTDVSYQHRSPVSPQNQSIVPYGFDIRLKPLMRLSGGSDLEAERDTLLDMLSETATDFALDYNARLSEVDNPDALTEAYMTQAEAMTATDSTYRAITAPTVKVCDRLRTAVKKAAKDCAAVIAADYPADPAEPGTDTEPADTTEPTDTGTDTTDTTDNQNG